MSTAGFMIAYLALVGAIVAWVAGAYYYLQTLRTASESGADSQVRWMLVFAWLFAVGRLKGSAAESAAKVNKAVVAFIACVIVAAAAFAVAANLARGAL